MKLLEDRPNTAAPVLSTRIQFSDEQAMLLEAASSFCRERSSSAQVRQRLATADGFDAALWQDMVQMGWLGLAVPEAHGGSGLPPGHLAVLAEPMGRHLLATPFASCQLVVAGLVAAGQGAGVAAGTDVNEQAHQRANHLASLQAQWLPRLAQGLVASVAVFEDSGSWDLLAPDCQAQRLPPTPPMPQAPGASGAAVTSAHVSLHGIKTGVCDAALAELLLVSVQFEGAPALAVLARADLPDGALQDELPIDSTRRSQRLRLDGCQIPLQQLVTGAAAQRALRAIQHTAWLLGAAEAAGGIAGVLDVVVDYLNTRVAFGRKIGSYQGLKHACADILVQLERSRSHVAHAATLLSEAAAAAAAPQGAPHGPSLQAELALRMAQAEACDSFVHAGDRAVQFHGGFGFTWDCDAQLYLRRALWLAPWFGDAAHHRRRIGDLMWPPASGS